jgi:hypothetical protein
MLLAAAVLAIVVGVTAYNAGVGAGMASAAVTTAQAPGAAAPNPPAPYGYANPAFGYPYWHRPFAFAFFPPLFGLLFLFLIVRMFVWGGLFSRRWRGYPPYWSEVDFEERHRRAHERMRGESPTVPS